jgi:hypothetical protein
MVKPNDSDVFLGCIAPYAYFSKKLSNSNERLAEERLLSNFTGLESLDYETVKCVMDFGFYIAFHDLDNAFKSVKSLKGNIIWLNMAKMCVKLKNLRLARHCLSQLSNLKIIFDINRIREDDSVLQLAMLAFHLGEFGDAEKLLTEAKRYSELSRLYQVCFKNNEGH